MFKCNEGVHCDVKNCKFNKDGFMCKLERISVTRAGTENHHFCGSFRQR